ncbi:MAG TPA: pyridoxal-dependent decarboxylase, partial [Bacillota bacterium]|nr:pyridoxal-dependent decarboxylase [Bacillota bacterium]
AARHRAALADGWDMRAVGLQGGHAPMAMYVSEDGHNCLRKAAELLGLGARAVRVVPLDAEFRMDVAALRAMLAADRAAGWRPFCVAASAGTTNTGAIDPLHALADLCAAEGIWLHVDGAYGAFAALDPEVAPHLAALGRADSLALDPHKWLQVPLECGCALVRNGDLLRATFSMVPPYLRDEEGRPGFDEYGFQQTRGFRALKVWACLQQAGRAGMAEMIIRHRRLAQRLADALDAAPDFERAAPVTLSVVCFRYAPPGLAADAVDRLQGPIARTVQAGGEAFITTTVLRGRPVLRACILHRDTTAADVAALVDVVRRAGRT